MSVSNLLAPNDYVLYVESQYADNFDSVDFGGDIAIGAAKAQLLTIGNVGAEVDIIGSPVKINGEIYPPGQPGSTGDNLFYGPNTGNTGATGVGNVAFGISCLQNLDGGDFNVAIGAGVLSACTFGGRNMGFGTTNLLNLTTGDANLAMGVNAMSQATTASDNIALGDGCLSSLLTGNSNICIGVNTGGYTGAEGENICIGGGLGVAGESNAIRIGTSGTSCIAIGARALSEILAGTDSGSIAIGLDACRHQNGVTSSGPNIGIGHSALENNIDGNANVAIGFQALQGITGNNANIAIGNNALVLCVGEQNIAIGNASGSNICGDKNVVIGNSALGFGATGNYNVGVGYQSLYNIVSSNNIGIGYQAGMNNTSATGNNIFLGNTGAVADADTIKIGTSQTVNVQAGIFGANSGATGLAVVVGSDGTLGTVASSKALKDNIQPLKDVKDIIAGLEPVSFYYKAQGEASQTVGLIADDAKEFIPELVTGIGKFDEDGIEYETIQYQLLPIYLLKEVQRLQKVVDGLVNKQ